MSENQGHGYMTTCAACGTPVDMRENDTPGVQMADGKWVCSHECWEIQGYSQPDPHPCPKCQSLSREPVCNCGVGPGGMHDPMCPVHPMNRCFDCESLTAQLEAANKRVGELEALCKEAYTGIYPKGRGDWEKRVATAVPPKDSP